MTAATAAASAVAIAIITASAAAAAAVSIGATDDDVDGSAWQESYQPCFNNDVEVNIQVNGLVLVKVPFVSSHCSVLY